MGPTGITIHNDLILVVDTHPSSVHMFRLNKRCQLLDRTITIKTDESTNTIEIGALVLLPMLIALVLIRLYSMQLKKHPEKEVK
ncbi:MAG: hypothetical protein ACXAD7_09775 [Candidatus Kariarchaeaceae archaeon]